MATLKRTPLYPVYARHAAKTIDFGGWELPVHFSGGIQREHESVRTKAGLFDVSHMGEVLVSGDEAETLLQFLTTNDVGKLVEGQAQYSLMCYPDGGVVDDLLVYKLDSDQYMLVVNAANAEKDADWLRKHAEGDVSIEDISSRKALLALQGPHAAGILERVTDAPVRDLAPFRFMREAELRADGNDDAGTQTVKALISRTGYTGEDGFEIYVNSEHAIVVWDALLDAGEADELVPVGLGARDTLRFEARLPLYGQELSAQITPLEAGLGLFVKLDKGDFIGKEALAAQKENGVPRKLVGLEMIDRGIPRANYTVHDNNGRQVGFITTGTQSPTFKLNVGLALVETAHAEQGAELWVDVRGKRLKAKIVKTPFYKSAYK